MGQHHHGHCTKTLSRLKYLSQQYSNAFTWFYFICGFGIYLNFIDIYAYYQIECE